MRDALGAVQSVLVLGGTSEIALATVRALIGDRCRTVVLAARRPDELSDTVAELRTLGATTVDTVAFDALDTSTHGRVVDAVFDAHRDIDLVIVAFGVLGDQAVFDADPDTAAAAAQVNFVGAVTASLHVARRMREQGHGTIVELSSVAAERARKANYVYGATKAGLDAFSQGLGDALVGTGVRVVVVRPGFVHTAMTAGMDPAPFATTPEAVAEAIVAGLQKGHEIIWAPGVLRVVFSVMRHLPRPVWRRVSAR
jgi:decaprenylphospho-beta-D-erythro-pentofuranosid-2-ulose 2-reductase